MNPIPLALRVEEMAAWARSRIEHCRKQEAKFGAAWTRSEKRELGPPQALVEAWTERHALQAVLEQLDEDRSTSVPPSGEKT